MTKKLRLTNYNVVAKGNKVILTEFGEPKESGDVIVLNVYTKENLKSAVQGLEKNMEEYVETVWKKGNAEEIKMAEIMKGDVKKLIKKWFPDVLEKGEKENE